MLYIFLLLTSRADMDAQRSLEGLDPTVLFEQVCADILLNFWGGATALSGSLVFGTARTKTEINQKFREFSASVCKAQESGFILG